MTESKAFRAKRNIVASLGSRLVTLICGLVVPRLLIATFGSETYGATASIAQFLAYITLLEGGIGGVARAALYRPLAKRDMMGISRVVSAIKKFFRVIAGIFVVYTLVLACSFKYISGTAVLDWSSTFFLVLVISLSTLAQYFVGISYAVLLQADQKNYITDSISMITTGLNACLVVLLVYLKADIITVKLVSSCVFVLRPVLMWLYVKRKYALVNCDKTDQDPLSQKWTGLSQHIAYFLHSNTDIAVLTVLADLTSVAVYSVYNMVIANIQNLTVSFSAGMEAMFGDMLAKREMKPLKRIFNYYETMISGVAVILFAATAVLIVPFVRLYTAKITDAEYIAPVFAVLLTLAALVYCLRMPYHSMTIAAGHFKQTQAAAYGEAAMNVLLSVLLVRWLGLIGVAVGTLAATVFRFIYYVIYLKKHILQRKIRHFVKRSCINAVAFIASVWVGNQILVVIPITDYLSWIECGALVTVAAAVIVFALDILFYRQDTLKIIRKVLPARKKEEENK